MRVIEQSTAGARLVRRMGTHMDKCTRMGQEPHIVYSAS
jgi:hypothetical protein